MPAGQGAHAAAPGAAAKEPSAQSAHAAAADAPATLLKVPGAQRVHDAEAADHVPAGHGGPHAADAAGVSVPAAQAVHDVDCGAEKVPAAHAAGVVFPSHALPAGHGAQI